MALLPLKGCISPFPDSDWPYKCFGQRDGIGNAVVYDCLEPKHLKCRLLLLSWSPDSTIRLSLASNLPDGSDGKVSLPMYGNPGSIPG